MLQRYTTEEYKKIYSELPPKVRPLFWEEDIGNRMENIAKRHELSRIKYEKLRILIAHIFLGLLPPKNIKKTVKEEIDANPDHAEKITVDINRLIVAPTKHLLKEVYEDDHEEDKDKKEVNGDAYREPIE